MKKLLTVIAGLILSSSAHAVLISEVGTIDNLLGQTSSLSNSSAGAEQGWIEEVLGLEAGSLSYTQLTETVSDGSNWEAVEGGAAGDYAFQFDTGLSPDYFLIKTGDGNGTNVVDSHYLYENNESFDWAYVNLTDFGPNVSVTNIDVISHVGLTGETGKVPAPATLALVALGLLGLGIRRKKA